MAAVLGNPRGDRQDYAAKALELSAQVRSDNCALARFAWHAAILGADLDARDVGRSAPAEAP
jgi:hypothetical protein